MNTPENPAGIVNVENKSITEESTAKKFRQVFSGAKIILDVKLKEKHVIVGTAMYEELKPFAANKEIDV